MSKVLADDKLLKLSPSMIGGAERPAIRWFSTGNLALDWCISDKIIGGGLPLGRVVELFGPPSSGKSLIVNKIMGGVQAADGIALYDDVEVSRDEEFMQAMGCNTAKDALMTASNKTVQQHFRWILATLEHIRSAKFDGPIVAILDSLAALSTEHEVETGLDKVDMSRAKVIKAAMRLAGGEFNDRDALYIVNNHTIANMGYRGKGKAPADSPGGGGVKFHASVRIELQVRGKIMDDNGFCSGVMVKAIVVKNKLTIPFRSCEFSLDFKKGVSKYDGIFPILVGSGVIIHAGVGWYTFPGDDKKMREKDILPLALEKLSSKDDCIPRTPLVVEGPIGDQGTGAPGHAATTEAPVAQPGPSRTPQIGAE